MQSVQNWTQRGCPYLVRGERGTPWVFDLLAVAQWRLGGASEARAEIDPEQMEPKVRLDWYRGERERLVLERDRGRLLDADEVAAAWLAQIGVAKGRLLTLPARLASDLLGLSEPREAERILRAALTEVLEELANG